MRYKKISWGIILGGVFCFLWLYLNRNYLPEIDEMGMQGIIYLTSAYAGYNCISSHGSIYAMLFVMVAQDILPKDSVPMLLRMKRKSYVLLLYKQLLSVAFIFSMVFLGVLIVCTMLFVNGQTIIDTGFLIGAGILLIYLMLYYFFIGSIYCFLKLNLMSNSWAVIGAIGAAIALFCLSDFVNIWTPVSVMDVFDLLFSGGLYLEAVCINIFSIVVLILAIYFITLYLFKDKDILDEEK